MKEQDAAVLEQIQSDDVLLVPSIVWQVGVGLVVVVSAVLWALGVWFMPVAGAWSEGARLFPALCAAALLLCGGWLVWEALYGGWRNASTLSGYPGLQITPWVWVSAGVLLGGGLIRYIGFVLAVALCYVLALQGLRLAADPQDRSSGKRWLGDGFFGGGLAVLVFVVFTQAFGISLSLGGVVWN